MKAKSSLTYLNPSRHCLMIIFLLGYNLHFARSQMIIESLPDAEEELVSCHVPTGEASYCVPLKRCPQISALFAGLPKPAPPDITKYIKKSFVCLSKELSDQESVCCHLDSIINPKVTERPRIGNNGNVFFLYSL